MRVFVTIIVGAITVLMTINIELLEVRNEQTRIASVRKDQAFQTEPNNRLVDSFVYQV